MGGTCRWPNQAAPSPLLQNPTHWHMQAGRQDLPRSGQGRFKRLSVWNKGINAPSRTHASRALRLSRGHARARGKPGGARCAQRQSVWASAWPMSMTCVMPVQQASWAHRRAVLDTLTRANRALRSSGRPSAGATAMRAMPGRTAPSARGASRSGRAWLTRTTRLGSRRTTRAAARRPARTPLRSPRTRRMILWRPGARRVFLKGMAQCPLHAALLGGCRCGCAVRTWAFPKQVIRVLGQA